MKGGVPDPFDDRDAAGPPPNGAVLVGWAAVAVAALMTAVVALVYGMPDRGPAPAPAPRTTAAPDPMPTGTVADRFPRPGDGLAVDSGRSDLAGSFDGRAADDLGAEIARLKIENAALRQTTDVLRNQLAILSERFDGLEAKFGALTGSVDPAPRAPSPAPAAPSVMPQIDAGARDRAATRSTQVVSHTQFGIELGSYQDLSAVKAAWRKLQAEQPGLFADLDALATVRDRGGAAELLLVAGPFDSADGAADRCDKVERAGIACLPAFYLGQALAVR